ncbi:MAG: autotransporter-associated beta strand repeat-containing protein, partial [Patescibacteria group bacterium]|nr:autotransporter-associated beta strand repeat-containing protein [Patescibacteria group bacterium]
MLNNRNVMASAFVDWQKQRQRGMRVRLAAAIAAALLIAQLATFMAAGTAAGATVYWSGTAGTSDWTSGSNWEGNTAPVDDLISDLAGFRSSSYVTQPSVGAARQVAGVVVAGTSAAFTLGGTSVLTLGQGGITVDAGAGILTISAPLTLGASQTWLTNGTGTATISGTLDLGGHTLTSAGTNNRVFSGVISGSGGSLVKTGSGTLTLNRDNPSSGAPNTFDGGVRIVQGILQVESPAMGAADGTIINNPLGTGAVRLAGGQLNLRVNGNDSSNVRGYTYGNDLIVENAPSTINLDRRTSSGGTNRNLLFNSLTLDNAYLTVTTGSSYRLGITGDILLVGHGVINGGEVTNFNTGRITDAGQAATFNKVGGATFNLLGTGNDYSGGTVVHGGALRVGSGDGTSVTNATAVAGTGPIVVNPGAAASFLSSGNLAPGQTVHVISHRSGLGVFSMQFNAPPDALRTTGSGVLAFTGTNNQDIDLASLGDGTWTLGSLSGPGSGTFNGTLAVGAGDIYRLGGASGTLTLGGTANMLTGSASLEVGRALINAGTPGQGTGTVVLSAANDYAGGTLVNRGSTLRIQQGGANNPLGAGAVQVFGTLTADGADGSFINAGGTANNNAITLYGGSTLRFDNSALSTGTNVDRWDDNTPIHLLAGTLQLDARNHASVTNETVGAIHFTGGNTISLNRNNMSGSQVAQLTVAEFVRADQGTIEFTRSGSSGYASNIKILATTAPAVTNGMIAPYFLPYDVTTAGMFASYDSSNGIGVASFDVNVTTASFTAGLTDGTKKVYVEPTIATTLADNPYIHALKTAQDINRGAGTKITIGSGGLIIGGLATTTAATRTIAADLYFGNGTTAAEAFVYATSGWNGVLTGTITADGLTKFGAGTAIIRSDNSSTMTTGAVSVNRGSLQLEHAAAVGSRPILLAGGQLNLRAATATTFNNAVTLGQNIPIATIDVRRSTGSGDNQTLTIPTLTLEGSATPQGQTLT